MKRVGFLASIFALTILSVSCGSSGPKLYPVSGKVMYQGKPAVGATIVFQPASGVSAEKPAATGQVDEEGNFTLNTHPHGDGCPEGEYVILISKYPENGRELDNAQSLLPAKYADPALAINKATIKPGDNLIPTIELK